MPQIRWLEHLFLTTLGAGRPRSRYLQILCLVRAASWFTVGHFLSESLQGGRNSLGSPLEGMNPTILLLHDLLTSYHPHLVGLGFNLGLWRDTSIQTIVILHSQRFFTGKRKVFESHDGHRTHFPDKQTKAQAPRLPCLYSEADFLDLGQ